MAGKYDGIDWHARARALRPRGEALIDGRRVGAQGGATFTKHSPIDGRKLGEVAAGDSADIDAA
ncbi:MAG TPA: aldehyde dehydrogenase PuuC, partial [Burkholderiaceae bacterium]|nr:aldehyde dehydrogenase PuuC [Burkholderiaceae bacterium]